MYHINHEGKVLPCKAVVLDCPYGKEAHSHNKKLLYYKVLKRENKMEPAFGVRKEVENIGRIISLYPLSKEIENSKAPVELILSSLNYVIEKVDKNTNKGEKSYHLPSWIEYTREQAAGAMAECMAYNLKVAGVPDLIMARAYEIFDEQYGGRMISDATYTRDRLAFASQSKVAEMRDSGEFREFERWANHRLTKSNYADTRRWLEYEFQQFSHDLNTSKMITQPIFIGSVDQMKQSIAKLDDYELLSAYDDYMVTDSEIESALKEANYFKYEDRDDLSQRANNRLRDWYKMNEDMMNSRLMDKPRKIKTGLLLAEELDKRGLKRGDSTIRKK